MKKNLISGIVLLFVMLPELFASTYEWSAQLSKNELYQNEPLYIKYICRFSDRAEFYAVEFAPMRDDADLSIEVLSETSRLENGARVLEYEFVLFFHQTKEYTLAFDALMKKTTKDSIENTIIGRDNGKYAEYETTKIEVPTQKIRVKPVNAPLVGSFKLEVKKDAPQIKSMLPYHLELRLSGKGNFKALSPVAFEIEGVKVFSAEPTQELRLTQEGYIGEWSQKFAFVSSKDFHIDGLKLEVFDPQTEQIAYLEFEGVDVKVTPAYTQEELLDLPKEKPFFDYEMLYYLLSFIAGFLVAKLKIKLPWPKKRSLFCQKVQEAASLDALCVVLILEDAKRYEILVQKIESHTITSLRKAKRLICR